MMSSLFIASTGLQSQSRGMQVIGNNISNVNTVGFKQSMAYYQDLFATTQTTPSNNITNISQLGMGSAFADTRTLFTMGGLQSSNTVTDMAINGNGYFGVMKDGEMLYTKAGNMRFDKNGFLLDPTGANLVGYKITNGVTANAFSPIQVDMSGSSPYATNPPRATTAASVYSNLGGMADNSTNAINEVFAMTVKWDGTKSNPLTNLNYGYSDPLTVFDANGNEQQLNISYDYVGTQNGMKLYEFAVGMNPALDGSANAGTAGAGLLMTGTLTFNSNGQIIGMTAYTPTGGDPTNLSAWTPAALQNGSPVIPVNFAGSGQQNIALDFGLKLNSGYDPNLTSPTVGASNPDLFYAATSDTTRVNGASTSYGTNQANRYQTQNGYAEGQLRDLKIDEDGFITARYSNGQTEDLYRITLFRFKSQDGLRHEGGNHYSATAESGAADAGYANVENYGSILSNHLEASNVDISREFTNMIITQRGFQANSKIITTSDTMLQKALELKR